MSVKDIRYFKTQISQHSTQLPMSLLLKEKSHPLSNSDLLVLRDWVCVTAIGFLTLGVYATFLVTVIYQSLWVFN